MNKQADFEYHIAHKVLFEIDILISNRFLFKQISPSFFNITLCFDIIVCHTQNIRERLDNLSFPINLPKNAKNSQFQLYVMTTKSSRTFSKDKQTYT